MKITGFKGINLIGYLEGSEKGPVILLNCHLDTVKECAGWSKDPYNPTIENGRLYGLGALDMKSGCAALLEQKRMGLDPVFVPERCGIKNAEIWHSITEKNYPEQLTALKEAEKNGNKVKTKA
ncbi:MAG: peptidase [Bacillota bacterium]|nr:peptidase [Bacillota bacterium]